MTTHINEHINDDYAIDSSKIETFESNSLQFALIEKMEKDLPTKTGTEENRKIRSDIVAKWANKYAKAVREIINNPLNEEIRKYIKDNDYDMASEIIKGILENKPIYH